MGRTTYTKGPAVVVFGSDAAKVSLYSEADISIDEKLTTEVEDSDAFGPIKEFVSEREVDISFTPKSILTTSILNAIFPYMKANTWKIGDPLFPQVDVPLAIYGFDGTIRSYKASAVWKMPSVHLGMKKPQFGEISFKCLGVGDAAWGAVGETGTEGSLSSLTQTGGDWDTASDDLDATKLIRDYATLNWGAAPFDAFTSVDGVDIDFNLGTDPDPSDKFGVQNYRITGLDVSAKFAPNGITEAQLAARYLIQGATAARGASLTTMGGGNDLTVSIGTTPLKFSVVVKGASIKDVKYAHSKKTPRIASIETVAQRSSFKGYLSDYATVGIS